MREILERLRKGEITVEDAEVLIKEKANLGIFGLANFDVHREERTGIPEVVLAEGKNSEHLLKIIDSVLRKKKKVIITRLGKDQIEKIREFASSQNYGLKYNDLARVCVVRVACLENSGLENRSLENAEEKKGKVAIITAGTSDIPVAEEAKMIAED